MLSHARRRLARTAPPVLAAPFGPRFVLAGVALEAEPDGALWIEAAGALVISDLHFEKGSSYAPRGQLIPPYDTRDTLRRLDAAIARRAPRLVISLGDGFHDLGGPTRMHEDDRAALQALVNRVDWVWIEGNHDPEISKTLGGRARAAFEIGALVLRHEPYTDDAEGEVAGHFHPCARIAGRGRCVRARCFAFDARRLIMPAFGAYTGGLNVRDAAFAPLFPDGLNVLAAARGRIYPVAPSRLVCD